MLPNVRIYVLSHLYDAFVETKRLIKHMKSLTQDFEILERGINERHWERPMDKLTNKVVATFFYTRGEK